VIFVALFNPLIHTVPISLVEYAVVFALGFSIIIFMELGKRAGGGSPCINYKCPLAYLYT
jgi:hypothetical protein